MNRSSFLLVFVGVMLNAAAQLMLKAGVKPLGALSLVDRGLLQTVLAVLGQPFILAGLASYVVSVAIWIGALSRLDVSIAYPMLSMGYVVNALLAWQLFGEPLTAGRLAGMGIIIVGVWVLARS